MQHQEVPAEAQERVQVLVHRGCLRGDLCAYLRKVDKDDKENKKVEVETQSEETSIDNDKKQLCSIFIENERCLCNKYIVINELVIKSKKSHKLIKS